MEDNNSSRAAKIAELASYLPEQVHPPSRAAIDAWQKTNAFAEARRTNKVREAMNALCTREPTRVVIGEPDTANWTDSMRKLKASCDRSGRSFTLKVGHDRTMYLKDDDALDAELAAYIEPGHLAYGDNS